MENHENQQNAERPPQRPVQEEQQQAAPSQAEQRQIEPEQHPAQTDRGLERPDGPQPDHRLEEPARYESGGTQTQPHGGETATAGMESAGLLPYHEADGYRRRWEQIQGSFVDDPKACCEQADALVIEVLQRMSQVREEHRTRLRGALDQGGDTEGLRLAMQQYRAFFSGLLKA